MRGKRGWIRILEATIAVLIVSATMIAVYSNQSVKKDESLNDYSYSLQREILSDIVINTTLRLDVLSVKSDFPGDSSYDALNVFVAGKVPDSFGYVLRVCDLNDTNNFCKMDAGSFISTLDKDVLVEETIVSAEIGNGSGDQVYSPKKVKLFFWQGGFPANFCRDECSVSKSICSSDAKQVLNKSCGDIDNDSCLEYGAVLLVRTCGSGDICVGGECVGGGSMLTCSMKQIQTSGCVYSYDDECNNYDGGEKTGSCGFFGSKDKYECWDYITTTTGCSANPSCPTGYTLVNSTSCISSVASLSASYDLGVHTGDNYYYDVTLSESGGVGVTISSGKRCFVVSGNCYYYTPSFVIPAGGSIVRSNQNFDSDTSDTAVYTYYGIDANGNSVQIGFSISTSEYP